MRNAGLEEAQAGMKTARRNINNLRHADDTTLMAESEEELKSLLMKVKEESEKVGLKLNIQKTFLENPMDCSLPGSAVHGVAKSWPQLHFHFHFSLSCLGEENGNGLQYSCLENPKDRGD